MLNVNGLTSFLHLAHQDLVQLYTRAIAAKTGGGAGGNPAAKDKDKDISKMTPAEKRKEIARRRAEAQKEKVRRHRRRLEFTGVLSGLIRVETCTCPLG